MRKQQHRFAPSVGFYAASGEPPVPPTQSVPRENRLLAGLAHDDRHRLLQHCEQVELNPADVLHKPGEPIRHVFFPRSGFISLGTWLDNHPSLEVGLVGNEGVVGIPLLLGIGASPLGAVVQGAGVAERLSAAAFQHEVGQNPMLQRDLHRYIYVLLAQLAQTAACVRFHVLDARLARWLLMSHDRAQSDQFHVTHETLAHMLGVRRVGVTKSAGGLQKRKLISYSRGDVTILDRNGLEAASCGCYRIDQNTYARLLG